MSKKETGLWVVEVQYDSQDAIWQPTTSASHTRYFARGDKKFFESEFPDAKYQICKYVRDDLDEAPSAYKSIQDVMANQIYLVKIVTELSPLAVVKG